MAAFLAAWGAAGWRASLRVDESMSPAWLHRDVPVDVQVEGLPQAVPGGALFDARVLRWFDTGASVGEGGASLPQHLALRMNVRDGDLPRAGQQWHLSVRMHAPDGLSNPAGFDATLPYFERGVRAIGTVRDRGTRPVLISETPERPWQGCIDRWRQHVRTLILQHVEDKRAAGVLAGLSIGDQSAIEHDDWDVFRRTGVAHLVSISGTHIAMFGWLAAMLIRRAWARWGPVHRWPAPDVAQWAAFAGSAFYALVAGWGVPAQRTVWMMFIVALLRTSGRRWPWPLTLLWSAVLITALDPWALRQVGFWLSYVAVAVLMGSGLQPTSSSREAVQGDTAEQRAWLTRAMQSGLTSAWGFLRESFLTQRLVTLALMPLTLVCFNQVSLSSLLANMVAIPVFTFGITPLSLLGALWSPFWRAGSWLIEVTMRVLTALASWSHAMAGAPQLPWWAAGLAVMAGFAWAWPARWAWRLASLPFLVPLLWLPQAWRMVPAPPLGQFTVLAADIGQGTSVLVRTSHHDLLFDTGPRIGEQLNAGERTLLPLMRAMGVSRLDTLVISHQDTDHVGGAASIVSAMPVGLLRSSLAEDHPLRSQVGIDGHALPHVACTAGQAWEWDGVRFEFLHPAPQDYADREDRDPNAMSCVLRVSTISPHPHSAMLTGDIEAPQEQALLARTGPEALHADLLIAPHHGSDTSSTEAFLQAVAPVQTVMQAGRRNRYGHPSRSVIERYDAMGLPWTATPDCGAFLWRSDEAPDIQQPSASSPRLSTNGPRIGTCWRMTHLHYWDVPSATTHASKDETGH